MSFTPQPRAKHTRRPGLGGFTLIEVMGAILMTSIVISIAVAFQMNLGSATGNARERLRTQRQAVALLDRMARDLAGAYFIAPRIVQGAPTATPWIFLTVQDFLDEGLTSESSNAIKFITRNYVPQALDGHSSDLALVAYYVEHQVDRPGYQLMRWRTTHMPREWDPTFPAADDPDADVMGEDIASFKIRVINQTGAEDPVWSSIRKGGRLALPLGVKLELSMLTPEEIRAAEEDEDFELPELEDRIEDEDGALLEEDEETDRRKTFSKTVMLPLRPLDWSFLEEVTRPEQGLVEDATDAEDADGEDDFFDDRDRDDERDDVDEEDEFDDETGRMIQAPAYEVQLADSRFGPVHAWRLQT